MPSLPQTLRRAGTYTQVPYPFPLPAPHCYPQALKGQNNKKAWIPTLSLQQPQPGFKRGNQEDFGNDNSLGRRTPGFAFRVLPAPTPPTVFQTAECEPKSVNRHTEQVRAPLRLRVHCNTTECFTKSTGLPHLLCSRSYHSAKQFQPQPEFIGC